MSTNQIVVEELYAAIEHHGLMPVIKNLFGVGAKIQMPFSKSSCEANITALDLSVRSTTCLARAGHTTVEQVIDAIQNDVLLSIRNLGKKCRTEIREKICEFGYSQLCEKSRKQFIRALLDLNKSKIH